MRLFGKKHTSEVVEEHDGQKELSPFEEVQRQIVEFYSDFDYEQLFTIHLVFEHGAECNLTHQDKKSIGWFIAHKNSDTEGIFQYAVKDGLGIGIDLRKVIILIVKLEETLKDEEDAD